MHASDSTHESDDDAAPGLSAVLLQGKNEYSSSAQPYLSLISLADDNDTPVPPKSGYLLCVCVYVDFSPLISEMNNEWQTTFI